MKWFKHDSDCFMSEGVDALIEAEGFSGYGRWMRLLEIVAFKMDETNRCHAEYSIQKWCSFLGLKQKKLISFLELTENKLKTKVVCFENIIRIEIPNLLKKRDNYTKDLEVTSKRLPSIDIEVEKEVEVEKKKKRLKPSRATLPDWLPREEWEGFVEMRKKAKSPLTPRAINLAISELEKLRAQGQDPGAVLNQTVMNGWKGLFPVKQGSSPSKPSSMDKTLSALDEARLLVEGRERQKALGGGDGL